MARKRVSKNESRIYVRAGEISGIPRREMATVHPRAWGGGTFSSNHPNKDSCTQSLSQKLAVQSLSQHDFGSRPYMKRLAYRPCTVGQRGIRVHGTARFLKKSQHARHHQQSTTFRKRTSHYQEVNVRAGNRTCMRPLPLGLSSQDLHRSWSPHQSFPGSSALRQVGTRSIPLPPSP